MPSPANSSTNRRGNFWPAIAGIFVAEIVVLLVLSAAFVAYLNSSSDVAFAEFVAASKLSAAAPHSPLQAVKGHAPCDWSA
jgi:hypothetical protein